MESYWAFNSLSGGEIARALALAKGAYQRKLILGTTATSGRTHFSENYRSSVVNLRLRLAAENIASCTYIHRYNGCRILILGKWSCIDIYQTLLSPSIRKSPLYAGKELEGLLSLLRELYLRETVASKTLLSMRVQPSEMFVALDWLKERGINPLQRLGEVEKARVERRRRMRFISWRNRIQGLSRSSQ